MKTVMMNDHAAELKHKGSDPQPVAVDGCGDTTKSQKGSTFHVSRVDQCGKSDSTPEVVEGPETPVAENGKELPQPVAVDGCGGALPSVIPKHDNENHQMEGVTSTAVWTEKPVFSSNLLPSQNGDALQRTIASGEATMVASGVSDDKGKCKDVAKDNSAVTSPGSLPHCMQSSTCIESAQEGYACSKPWVSALSTCDILAPIPEADVAADNCGNVEVSNIAAKPKALPLKVSPAARKGLAKIATPRTQPTRTQSLLDGYVHGLTVEANVKPSNPSGLEAISIREAPSNIDSCPAQSRTAGIPCFGSQGESDEYQLRHKPLRRSKSAGQLPLTPGRRAGTTGNSKSCPPA